MGKGILPKEKWNDKFFNNKIIFKVFFFIKKPLIQIIL